MWNLKSMDSTLCYLMTCFFVFSVIKTSPHFMHSTFCLLSKFPFFLFNILYRIWIILKQTLSIVIKSSVNNYKTHNCWRISICYIYGTQKAGPSTWKNSGQYSLELEAWPLVSWRPTCWKLYIMTCRLDVLTAKWHLTSSD